MLQRDQVPEREHHKALRVVLSPVELQTNVLGDMLAQKLSTLLIAAKAHRAVRRDCTIDDGDNVLVHVDQTARQEFSSVT